MMYHYRAVKVLNALPALTAIMMLAVCKATPAQAAGPTLLINYSSGFTGASSAFSYTAEAAVSGSILQLSSGSNGHEGGAAWSRANPVNVQSFTTYFTFQQVPTTIPAIAGMTFCIQNINEKTNPNNSGNPLQAQGDGNLAGYGAYGGQYPIGNSVAIKFDLNPYSQQAFPYGGQPTSTGLYINGGPLSLLLGQSDLSPYSINLNSGHVMSAVIVYDGTLLTMTLKDTTTNAQARYVWPINIPAVTGSNSAYVGFTGTQITPYSPQSVLTWQYYSGYNTRLATPTFSVTPGQYTSTQSVSIGCASGATCYFTTNGLLPTTSSTKYNGTPISVSSNEVIQAVAIESGYTDSLVATGNYQIQSSSAPLINLANFSSPNGLIQLAGYAAFNSSRIQLTDTTGGLYRNGTMEVASAWYAAPVNIQTFSTAFTYQATNSACANQHGCGTVFVIQNQPQTTPTGKYGFLSGGTTYVGNSSDALGYGYSPPGNPDLSSATGGLLNSIGVKLDLTTNSTGLYTNGDIPNTITSPDVGITGGVNLGNGNQIAVAFTYNSTTLSMTLTDMVTGATFSHSWTINIPAIVGANTAYIGFTAATGYWPANQYIKSWTYATTPGQTIPVPAAPTNLQVL